MIRVYIREKSASILTMVLSRPNSTGYSFEFVEASWCMSFVLSDGSERLGAEGRFPQPTFARTAFVPMFSSTNTTKRWELFFSTASSVLLKLDDQIAINWAMEANKFGLTSHLKRFSLCLLVSTALLPSTR